MKVPCKDCTDRHLGCHSECEKYKAFDAERKKISDIRLKMKEEDELYRRKTKK